MGEKPNAKRSYSRRQFLKGVPIGVAGAAAVGLIVGRFLPSSFRRRRPPVFAKGSIFTPAKERRTDV